MSRIKIGDTVMDIFLKMAEGNPGAVTVLMKLHQASADIDPQDFMGPLGAILALDSHGIYGSRIWMFYKDVCKENLVHLIAVLRACQLGFIPEKDINHAIDNYGEGLDVQSILKKVKEQLEEFDRNNVEEEVE